MPTFSMFDGVVSYLYFSDNERCRLRRIPGRCRRQEASFPIEDGADREILMSPTRRCYDHTKPA